MIHVQQLNHVALPVTDLGRSVAFYERILGLKQIARPDFSFPGAWFRLGIDQQLHLIARGVAVHDTEQDKHFALMVDDITQCEQHLRAHHVSFIGPKRRPDGAMQIFVPDPDGHMVELSTSPVAPESTDDRP